MNKSPTNTFRVLHQNICMGQNGVESFRKGVWSQLKYYFSLKPESINKTANIPSHLDVVLNKNPSVLGLSEVFGTKQREEVLNILRDAKLDYFNEVRAFEMPYQNEEGELLYNIIGSKHPIKKIGPDIINKNTFFSSESFFSRNFDPSQNSIISWIYNSLDNKFGTTIRSSIERLFHGGILDGVISNVEITEYDVTFHHAHLPLSNRYDRGTVDMVNTMLQLNETDKQIFFGDMNNTHFWLKNKIPLLDSYRNITGDLTPTCSMTPLLNKFYSQRSDHVFATKDIKAMRSDTFKGVSDHAGVWADVRVK